MSSMPALVIVAIVTTIAGSAIADERGEAWYPIDGGVAFVAAFGSSTVWEGRGHVGFTRGRARHEADGVRGWRGVAGVELSAGAECRDDCEARATMGPTVRLGWSTAGDDRDPSPVPQRSVTAGLTPYIGVSSGGLVGVRASFGFSSYGWSDRAIDGFEGYGNLGLLVLALALVNHVEVSTELERQSGGAVQARFGVGLGFGL